MVNFSSFWTERGSALVIALLMLVVLTILGIAAITTSTVEVQISGNEKVYKRSFYAADGGTSMYSELLEQNIDNRQWADNSTRGDVKILKGTFYLNRPSNTPDATPSDTNRDAFFPRASTASDPHTNVKVQGIPTLSTGSAIHMAAGYEGKGKSAAAGGAWIIYDVRAQYVDNRGNRNTQSTVDLGWRHVM